MATEPSTLIGTRRFPLTMFYGSPSLPPPVLRDRNLKLQENGEEIPYPTGLVLQLCKENLNGEIKHWRVPPRAQAKRPSPTMIAHARRGNLTGFLEGGKILRASDLEVESEEYLETYEEERVVDPETGALRLNRYRELLYGGVTGEMVESVAQAMEYQSDHLEEDDEWAVLKDRLAANLFYIALPVVVRTTQGETTYFAEDFLPTYHFWRRGPDRDPYERANYNIGRHLDLVTKFDKLKHQKKFGTQANPRETTSIAPEQAESVEEEEQSSGLSDPPDELDEPSPPPPTNLSKKKTKQGTHANPKQRTSKTPEVAAPVEVDEESRDLADAADELDEPLAPPPTNLPKQSTPPRARAAGKRPKPLSAPSPQERRLSNRSENVTKSTEFLKFEAEFEKQLRREGIQKVLDEVADYHPNEIAALRAKPPLTKFVQPSLRKKRDLAHDSDIIRQPLTTVAHKLARVAFDLPATPIKESDPLTRDDNKEEVESDLDWGAGFNEPVEGGKGTSGGKAGEFDKAPVGATEKGKKGEGLAGKPSIPSKLNRSCSV